ncbi:MAG TPA: hypothetical protein VJV78_26800 [Polyangiales bacterium]|nr:hypothetical protein [Polyangiales bacterium]
MSANLTALLALAVISCAQQVSAQASPDVAEAPRLRPLREPSHELLALRPPCKREDERQWFRGPLAASYLAPLVGLSVFALGANKQNFIWPGLVGAVSLFTPTLVHVAHDDAKGGLYAFIGMLTSSGVGAFAGYTISRLAPAEGSARDALVFGLLGYAIWAVLDVAFFGYHDERL